MQYLIVLFLAATATALDYGHSYSSYPYSYGGYYGHGGYGHGGYGSGLYGSSYGLGGYGSGLYGASYSYAPSYYSGGAAISKYIAPASYATTYAAPAVATSYAAPAAVSYVSRPATTYVAPKVATVAAAPAVSYVSKPAISYAAAPTYVAAAPRIQKYIAPAAPAITSYAAPAVTSYAAPAVTSYAAPAVSYVSKPAVSYVSRPAVVAAAPRIEKQQIISVKGPGVKTVYGAPHISFTTGHGKTSAHGGVSSGHFGDSFNTHKTTNHHSSSSDSRKGSGIGFYGLDSSRSGASGDSKPKPGVTYSANKPGGSTFSSPSFGTDSFAEDKNTEFDFPKSDKPGATTFSDDKPAVSSHSNDKSGGSPFDYDTSSDDDLEEFEFKDSDSDARRGVSTFSDDKPAVSTGFDKDTSRYSKPEVNEFPKPDAFSDSYKPETVSSYSSDQQGFTSNDKSQSGRFQKIPDFKGPQISFKMGSAVASASDATGFSGKILSRPYYGGYASGGQVKTQFLGMRPSVLYTEEPSYFSGSPAASLRNKIFYLTDDSGAGAYDYSSPSLLYSGNERSILLDAVHDSDAYVLVKKK